MIINAPVTFTISKEEQEALMRGSIRDDNNNPPVDIETTSTESDHVSKNK